MYVYTCVYIYQVEARPGCSRLIDWLLYWANPVLPAPLPSAVAALGAQTQKTFRLLFSPSFFTPFCLFPLSGDFIRLVFFPCV